MKTEPPCQLDAQRFAGRTVAEQMQTRANLYDQQKAMLDAAEGEGRDLTAEEESQFQELENQFIAADEKVKQAEAKEARIVAIAARGEKLNQTSTPSFRPAIVAGAPVQGTPKDDGGFQNLGEFVHAIRFGDAKGRLNECPIGQGQGGGYGIPDAFRGQLLPSSMRNEWKQSEGSSGGYAIPNQFTSDVLALKPELAIVRSRAHVLPAGDPPDAKITMPALHQGSKGVYGGVEVSWIEEGAEKPETDAKLSEVTLQPHEVAATTVITDKLLRNWDAAHAFIRNLLQNAMMAAEDIAFLTGTGVGKPTGVLKATGKMAIHRATANQITYVDTLNMRASLLPESVAGAVWVANLSALPQIATLQDPAKNYIFIQGDATKSIPATLAGMPIVFTGKTPTLGKKGDLMLIDFSYYLIKDGSGPFIAASEHVLFRQNKTVIKVFWNVDGKPWVIEPLALEDGVTQVTPYVILDIPKP